MNSKQKQQKYLDFFNKIESKNIFRVTTEEQNKLELLRLSAGGI